MVLDLASRRREVDSPVVSLGSVCDAAEVLVLVLGSSRVHAVHLSDIWTPQDQVGPN